MAPVGGRTASTAAVGGGTGSAAAAGGGTGSAAAVGGGAGACRSGAGVRAIEPYQVSAATPAATSPTISALAPSRPPLVAAIGG
jgi:hypothetical protein